MTFGMPFQLHFATVTGACLIGCLYAGSSSLLATEENTGGGFRDVLELAGIEIESSSAFLEQPDYREQDWQLLLQLLHRLGQYPQTQQDHWARAWSDRPEPTIGDLFDVAGTVEMVQSIALPEELARMHGQSTLYRCRFRTMDSAKSDLKTTGIVLTPHIPQRWHENKHIEEPIRFRGVLLQASPGEDQNSVVLLAEHLAWFPRRGVPTGHLLLARHGMDVGLLDEVVHRQPFVRPEVSREGEAFYACLAALQRTEARELDRLARQNVAEVAEKWGNFEPLRNAADRAEDEATRRQRAIAAAVLERSELGLSSVAPLFLQPEHEVGELVRIEGTVRRAMRIAAADEQEIGSYYELEVFTTDSQNLPVVCCVNRLPAGFPTGDVLREPVRVAGVFFKSWLYRTRETAPGPGETTQQRRLYTPIVVGHTPLWLRSSASRESRWGLWGGVAFLVVLAVVWINMLRLARRDQLERAKTGRAKIDISPSDAEVESTE